MDVTIVKQGSAAHTPHIQYPPVPLKLPAVSNGEPSRQGERRYGKTLTERVTGFMENYSESQYA